MEPLHVNLTGINMSSHRIDDLESKSPVSAKDRKMRDILIRPIGHPLHIEWSFVPKPKKDTEVLVTTLMDGLSC